MLSYATWQDEDPRSPSVPWCCGVLARRHGLADGRAGDGQAEKEAAETPCINEITSYSTGRNLDPAGLRESAPPKETTAAWYQVRKKIGDIKGTLPAGVVGPFFNDEFGGTVAPSSPCRRRFPTRK
jgi:hypothetical protein